MKRAANLISYFYLYFKYGNFLVFPVGKQVQNGHSYGYAIFHLVKDDGKRPVGHITVQLYAPVYWAGMHYYNFFVEAFQQTAVNTVG